MKKALSQQTITLLLMAALIALTTMGAKTGTTDAVKPVSNMQSLTLELQKTNALLATNNKNLELLHADMVTQNKAFQTAMKQMVATLKKNGQVDDTAINSIMKALDNINASLNALKKPR